MKAFESFHMLMYLRMRSVAFATKVARLRAQQVEHGLVPFATCGKLRKRPRGIHVFQIQNLYAKYHTIISKYCMFADVAQQVEHFLGKEEASSSNLPISSITPQTCSVVFFVCIC